MHGPVETANDNRIISGFFNNEWYLDARSATAREHFCTLPRS
jgi:hypothetical protein